MRSLYITLVLAAGVGLSSCARDDTAHSNEPAAHRAGREAYRASQDIKRGAKKAAEEINKAGDQLRDGWNDAKRQDRNSDKKK
jgi:hypothetical protein